jgi:hypothetical protein
VRGIVAAILVAAFLVSCTSAPEPSPSASGAAAAVKPAINEQTRGEIQALLQKQNSAMAKQDQTTFISTVDPERLALKRCANETYDISTRQGVPGVGQVGKIEAYGDTYVRGYVNEGSSGARRLYFRKLGSNWVQSEPKDDELGGEKNITVEDIQISYWGIDQDVIGALGKALVSAREVVLKNVLSEERRDPLAVRFYPTRGVAGPQSCSTAAFHLTNVAADPYVRFLRYWFTSAGEASPFTVAVASHEWLHWAQDQFYPSMTARIPWWAVEGWPDYVGQSRSMDAIKYVVCQTATPTLKQLEDGSDPNGPPELGANYQTIANTMVEYLYTQYGGIDAYRRLALAFKEDARSAIVFPKVLNITPEQFYDGWKAAAKKKYC